jgi:hypothetical protein
LLPRAIAAACPQLAKADFASSSQHVREGQRIAELEAEIDALQRQALALGAEPTAGVPPWVLLGVEIAAAKTLLQATMIVLDFEFRNICKCAIPRSA